MKSITKSYYTFYALFISALLLAAPCLLNLAYAHKFSRNESAAGFLSLIEQVKAESQLALMNLQNNNIMLAHKHADNALMLLDNGTTLNEIRERNNRIATSLDGNLEVMRNNIVALSFEGTTTAPSRFIQTVNQSIVSINNTLAEATTVRIDPQQRQNSSIWALAFAEIVDATLRDYGRATGAQFDFTNMANMGSMSMGDSNNSMKISSSMTGPSSSSNTKMILTNSSSNNNDNMSANMAKIINQTSYQSAQFLANHTLVDLFNNKLKMMTGTNSNIASSSSTIIPTSTQIDQLESGITALRNAINSKVSPQEVMMIVHGKIHPLLIQIYQLQTS